MKTLQTTPELKKEEKILTAGILLCIELDSNFKLYSYRCIDKTNFLDRTNALIKIYKDNL